MKTINRWAAHAAFILLFVTGLGWLLGQFGEWERNRAFQRWLNRHT